MWVSFQRPCRLGTACFYWAIVVNLPGMRARAFGSRMEVTR